MNFNHEQQVAIFSEKPLVVISAGAGSGKTRVLTERYVHICEQKLLERLGKIENSELGATSDEIVAITFTEKAAREMKDRIRKRIEEKRQMVDEQFELEKDQIIASAFWQEQKEALDSALITTFHSFCQKLLHEYAFEADVTPHFSILDDIQAKLLQLEIFDRMFDNKRLHEKWRPLFDFYTRHQLTEAIKDVYGQMREIVTNITSLEDFFDSETIIQIQLDIISNNKRLILEKFYEDAHVFVDELSFAEGLTKANEKHVENIGQHFSSVTDASFTNPTSLYEALVEAMPSKSSSKWKETLPPLYELYEGLFKPLKETWKSLQDPSDEVNKQIKQIIELFSRMLIYFHEQFEQAKRERAALDFSDLQQKAIAVLANPVIQEACRQKYIHMMIDEAQDTNQLQMDMLSRINPQYRFIVGDGKQSIYRFRGADVSLMKELVETATSDEKNEFVNMSTNYRTCSSIIEFVNEAFSVIMGEAPSKHDPSYKIHYTNIMSARHGDEEQKGRVELITIPKTSDENNSNEEVETNEFRTIVNRMLEIKKSGQKLVAKNDQWTTADWRDMAILIQTRSKLTQLERALKEKDIPYAVYGGIGFYEKQEVKDMLTLLHWLNRPWEPLYIFALLRSPLFGVNVEGFLTIREKVGEEMDLSSFIYEGKYLDTDIIQNGNVLEALNKLKQLYETWVPYRPQVSLRNYLETLFEQSGLKLMLMTQRNNLQLIKNVEKLIDVLTQFSTTSLDERLEQVKKLAALSDKEGEAEVELAEGNVVHIMTVHASKGLEFPIVFLPDLARGIKGDSGNIRFDKDVRLIVQYEKEKEQDPFKKVAYSSPSYEQMKGISKDQAVEEAKRLFYVAVTRAKDYLVLSTSEKPAKDSWYSMLLTAIEENSTVTSYLNEISEVSEQEQAVESDVSKDLPLLTDQEHMPITLSVSEIMHYLSDPLSYYYKHIVKIEDGWLNADLDFGELAASDGEFSGATLGTIVHRACELIDKGLTVNDAKQDALSMVEDITLLPRYEQSLDKLMEKYRELDSLDLGETIENEWPFVMDIADIKVIGEIDKITEKNGSYHIIDLKTNKSNDYSTLVPYYKPQLLLYKLAYEQKTGNRVDHVSLAFIREGLKGFYTFSIDDEEYNRIILKIKELAKLTRQKASKKDYLNK